MLRRHKTAKSLPFSLLFFYLFIIIFFRDLFGLGPVLESGRGAGTECRGAPPRVCTSCGAPGLGEHPLRSVSIPARPAGRLTPARSHRAARHRCLLWPVTLGKVLPPSGSRGGEAGGWGCEISTGKEPPDPGGAGVRGVGVGVVVVRRWEGVCAKNAE